MNIILRTIAVTCLLFYALSALGDDDRGSKNVLMFNAGTLNVGVMQLQFNDPTNPDDDTVVPISIIEEKSFGTFGRAVLKTLAKVTSDAPLPGDCPVGFPVPLVITDDAVVITFHDLSQLAGNSRTIVCIDPASGAQWVRGEGYWSGGTRRFADVTGGEFYIRSTATPQSTNGQFYATEGTISGRLERQ